MPAELDAWLEQSREEALDPSLPICDPHHHLWDKPGDRYMIDEVTSDMGSGHNVVQSIFVEVDSMYRDLGRRRCGPLGRWSGRAVSELRATVGYTGQPRWPLESLATPT